MLCVQLCVLCCSLYFSCFFFSSRRRHTRCALVTGVQTCALPISNTARAGDQITQRNLDIQPTITIRPGAPVRVLVTRDLILAPWREIGRASCRERVCQYV